jgi:GrpB-like predicted nucleotidyltransferase (UPF0157 family)
VAAEPGQLDEYLDRVLIGGRETRVIVIAEYDPAWPLRFAAEREKIARALGTVANRIEHIGSTAVPGLAAKPIVDILVAVADVEDEAAFAPALIAAGYDLRVREPGHRLFRTPARDVHVHLWAADSDDEHRHLNFRDRLRSSADDRILYERTKRELAQHPYSDTNYYAEAKTGVIREILEGGAAGTRP